LLQLNVKPDMSPAQTAGVVSNNGSGIIQQSRLATLRLRSSGELASK